MGNERLLVKEIQSRRHGQLDNSESPNFINDCPNGREIVRIIRWNRQSIIYSPHYPKVPMHFLPLKSRIQMVSNRRAARTRGIDREGGKNVMETKQRTLE